MQCPNCQQDAVAGAAFCNHCGTRMPALCPVCRAGNPPESRFCHECGASLTTRRTPSGRVPAPSRSPARETGIGDIGTDLKTLGADLATYSAPRIKRGGAATARGIRAFAVATAPRVKRGGVAMARGVRAIAVAAAPRVKSLAQRLKPGRSGPAALPPIPTDYAADELANPWPARPAPAAPAIACPRCRRVNEPDSLFCFSCGLPLDDAAPARAGGAPAYAGQPAGFWIRLGAWVIDLIILNIAVMPLIAVWPGFDEYFATDGGLLHGVDLLILVLYGLYYTIGVSVWATTIGKRLLGLYVFRPDGAKVGPGRAAARYCAGILSALIFGVGYLMIGLRLDKRGLHDLICDTVVTRQ